MVYPLLYQSVSFQVLVTRRSDDGCSATDPFAKLLLVGLTCFDLSALLAEPCALGCSEYAVSRGAIGGANEP